jgi:alkanesulfonate monooxygenase SsuD/methylene tetrahydromethanopterin reductase-like flavin-dependent oxidoreductase (luciferase family)
MTDTTSAADVTTSPIWFEQKRPMSLGLMVPIGERSHYGGTPRFADIVELCQTAADAGFDALWFADHFTFGSREDGGYRGIWECWTMMAGVAAAVPNLQIGSLVACTGFRNPGVIAKMTESIDEISDGRFILGLGAGWHEPEYRAFGFPFDHRYTRFEEAIRIIHPLLRTGQADLDGEFYRAEDAVNQPRGPRPTGAPILIGSNGERMLRLVARYADAWNTVWHKNTERVIPQLAKLDAVCAEIGRDPRSLVRTAGGNFAMEGYLERRPDPVRGDANEKASTLNDFRELGFRHFVCGLDPCTPETITAFGPVIEQFDATA